MEALSLGFALGVVFTLTLSATVVGVLLWEAMRDEHAYSEELHAADDESMHGR